MISRHQVSYETNISYFPLFTCIEIDWDLEDTLNEGVQLSHFFDNPATLLKPPGQTPRSV